MNQGEEVIIQNEDPAFNGKNAHIIKDDGNWIYLITNDGLRAQLPREQVTRNG